MGLTALTGSRDYVKVRKDLDVAGYRGEKIVLLVATDNPRLKPLSDVVAETLQKASMNVDYQAMDFGTMVQRRASEKPPEQGGWNVFCTGSQGLDFLSPATHQPLRCNGARAWFGWPTSPEIERLHDQWFDTPDFAGQKKICAEIQAQAFIDVPYYPLGLYYPDTAFRSDLAGMLDGFPIFWNVRRQA